MSVATNFISATGAWEMIGTIKQERGYHAMVVCPPFMIGKQANSANFSSSSGPSSHQYLLISTVFTLNYNPTADKTCKNERKI